MALCACSSFSADKSRASLSCHLKKSVYDFNTSHSFGIKFICNLLKTLSAFSHKTRSEKSNNAELGLLALYPRAQSSTHFMYSEITNTAVNIHEVANTGVLKILRLPRLMYVKNEVHASTIFSAYSVASLNKRQSSNEVNNSGIFVCQNETVFGPGTCY